MNRASPQPKLKNIFLCTIFIQLICYSSCFSANYFITPEGAGEKNGTDWLNAFKGKPPSFEKGSNYYIAGGDYTDDGTGIGWRWVISNPTGSGTISIIKATPSNSGTVPGYQDQFGNSQAVFATSGACSTSYFNYWGAFVIDTDDVTIDGSYRHGIKIVEGPDNWQSFWPTGYFKVGILVKNASNVECKNIFFNFDDDPSSEENPYIKIGIYDWLNDPVNLKIKNCTFNKGHIALRGTGRDNYIVDQCEFLNFTSADNSFPGWPMDAILSMDFSDIGEIARNTFSNCLSTSSSNRMITFRGSYNIHGNIVINSSNYRAVFYGGENSKIINNTFANSTFSSNSEGTVIHFGTSSNTNESYNNLFINIDLDSEKIISGSGVSNNNWCWDGSDNGLDECNQITLETESESYLFGTSLPDIFTNPANNGFTLKEALPGKKITIGSGIFNRDMSGKQRGTDGIWDKGAYEYGESKPFNPALLSSILISTKNGKSGKDNAAYSDNKRHL